jgi:RND superfamily putative drug exporter
MGLPIATALMGIGSGLALIALIGHIFPAPSFSAIVAALIGLGIGVDYALFIVTRFRQELRGVPEGRPPGPAQREELRNGEPGPDAVVTTMRTAGRAVLTAGTTVVIGMLGLLVLRQALLNGVAIAAAATVAMTVLAALTLLPALLGFTGDRLARPSRLNTWFEGRLFGRGRATGHARAAGEAAGTRRRGTRGAAGEAAGTRRLGTDAAAGEAPEAVRNIRRSGGRRLCSGIRCLPPAWLRSLS